MSIRYSRATYSVSDSFTNIHKTINFFNLFLLGCVRTCVSSSKINIQSTGRPVRSVEVHEYVSAPPPLIEDDDAEAWF